VTCPHNPVTALVGIFQSSVFLPHRGYTLSGFSPVEEFMLYRKQRFLHILRNILVWVFLKRWVPTTRKNRKFSHTVKKVLAGLLKHGLLPHKNHLPLILVLN
jgi:hypothetical protein